MGREDDGSPVARRLARRLPRSARPLAGPRAARWRAGRCSPTPCCPQRGRGHGCLGREGNCWSPSARGGVPTALTAGAPHRRSPRRMPMPPSPHHRRVPRTRRSAPPRSARRRRIARLLPTPMASHRCVARESRRPRRSACRGGSAARSGALRHAEERAAMPPRHGWRSSPARRQKRPRPASCRGSARLWGAHAPRCRPPDGRRGLPLA